MTGRPVAPETWLRRRERVTVVRSRVVRVIAAAVAAGAVLAGCGSGPNQAGSAVIVGGTAVSLAEVQSRFDAAIADRQVTAAYAGQGAQMDQVSRDIVSQAVTHDLVRRAAADAGITIPDSAVDQVIAADDRTTDDNQPAASPLESPLSLYDPDPASRREAVRDDLLLVEIGRREIDRLAVTIQGADASSQADAELKAKVALAGGPAADRVFTSPPQQLPVPLFAQSVAVQGPPVAWSLVGTPTGSVLVLRPPEGADSWAVARIVDRSSSAAPAPGAPVAADQLDPTTLRRFGLQMLQPLAMATDIRVNPRYGVWDPLVMAVVPADQVSGSVLAPPAR